MEHETERPPGGRETPALGDPLPQPDLAATQAAVQRLLDAGLFGPESRAHLLLDYLITQAHRQGPVPVKAYAIAVDVLGRGEDFDPGTDSIVRVELGRLRKALDLYYAGRGQDDPIRLGIPKGQSRIEIRPQLPTGTAVKASASREPPPHRPAALWGALALVLAGLGFGLWTALPLVHPPRVVIAPTQVSGDDPALGALAKGMVLHLAADLSQFRTFQVVIAPQPASALLNRVSYRIESRIEGRMQAARLMLVLIRKADGAVVLSQERRLDLTRENPGNEIAAMLGPLAGQIVGPRGALEADGRARLAEIEAMWLGRPPEEFLCLLRFQGYDLSKDETRRGAARTCLDRLTRARSPVGAIWAAEATMTLLDWSESAATGSERLAVAEAQAHRAVMLDPGGAEGAAALGAVLTAAGRFDAAEAALRNAQTLAPQDPEAAVRLGWLACLRGDWAGGTAQISDALDGQAAVPGWYRLPLALAALRAGDVAALAEEGRRIAASGDRRGLVLERLAARMRGDATEADRVSRQIAASGLSDARVAQAIVRLFPDPEGSGALLRALQP